MVPSTKRVTELSVSVKDRREVLFVGKATSVTSRNVSGEFDILCEHANFITLVYDYVLVDKGLSSEKKFPLKNGVITAVANVVNVYVGV